jgi:MFS family permease
VPLIVLERLHAQEAVVGLVFAVAGVFGMVATFFFGRTDTRGREWAMLVFPMLGFAVGDLLLLAAANATETLTGIAIISVAMAVIGLLNGPLDIALFTVRQRRTEQAWMGRAFAVSMAFNFVGFPVGAALTGTLAAESIELAILVGVVACLVAALLAATLFPRTEVAAAG